jgi:succinyl-CoA synthetase alpha subunit
MVVISVAGRHAAAEARKALDAGLHVMLFSDNVTLEQELELKLLGRERGLLVMGPDCGTAIINGVPLAFANVVGRGSIGIVAAAGTGCQEVSTLIANEGAGVSQAIGTGGRDVKKDVGGIMFLEALKALAEDEPTKVILLVSKPPHPDVLKQIEAVIAGIRKPVVPFFLGAARSDPASPATLEEAALMAVALSRGEEPGAVRKRLSARHEEMRVLARREAGKLKKGQKYLRGLFSGGTFCTEAQILFEGVLDGVHSNAPAGKARKLENSLRSVEHSVVDLGEDEFTVGRPHPMIDYSLRRKRIAEEAAEPSVAVILLDVVLGYGSHLDPASELVEPIRQAVKKVSVVCSVTGTDRDPQNRAAVVAALEQAGALVMPSNAAACKLAATLAQYVKE